MPIPDRIGYLLAVGNILVLFVFLPRAMCQHLPSRDEDDMSFVEIKEEILYDTGIVPDGDEVTVYLYKGTRKKYFFIVEENHVPLSLSITPCASPVHWKLTRKDPPLDSNEDDDDAQDPFLPQRAAPPPLGEFKGGGAMAYNNPNSQAGTYVIEIEAIKSDTYVQIFGTTTPGSEKNHPPLPSNRQVTATAKSKRTISFEWKGVKTDKKKDMSLEYCLSVSRIRNFQTHCSVLAHLRGDKLPTRPPNAGFGFANERKREQDMLRNAKPIKPARKGRIFYTCVGSKTAYTFNKAKPGKTYFIDVFVIDKRTNQASPYVGIVVTTDRKKRRKIQLEDGVRKTVTLRKGSKSQQLAFAVKDNVSEAVLELKSCRGVLPFEIIYSNKRKHKSRVKRFKVLHMKNLPAGSYIIKIKGKRKRKRTVSVYFTSNASSYRRPRLPMNTTVKVFDNLVTCNSVTLAWMGTDVKQKYCLYKKEVTGMQNRKRHRCSDPENRSKKEKVFCVRFKHKDRKKAVKTHIVKGLKPSTSYMFDMYVSRGRSGFLVYRSAVARTKSHC